MLSKLVGKKKVEVNMYEINSVSSLNLRSANGGEDRHLDDPIKFKCSICGVNHKLGQDAFVMLRIVFKIHGNEENIILCDNCADKFTDISVYGPRGAGFIEVKNSLIRASIQRKEKFCFNCLNGNGSHIFLKFKKIGYKGVRKFGSKRLCAQCSISYIATLKPKMVEKWT